MDWREREPPRVVFHVLALAGLDDQLGRALYRVLERRHASFAEQCELVTSEGIEAALGWRKHMVPATDGNRGVRKAAAVTSASLSVFPRELLEELRLGRKRLEELESAQATERQKRLERLQNAMRADLGALAPFAQRQGDFQHDTEEADFLIRLPSWPCILVRYAWCGGVWERFSFPPTFSFKWAILPHALSSKEEWILASDRAEALARAERVVMPRRIKAQRA